ERKPKKGQNRIKTGQKREVWRNQEKSEAVTVDRGRKTKENAKRRAKFAYSYKVSNAGGGCTLSDGSYSFILLGWFLLVVLLVYADEFVPAGHCTITTALQYKDDHNKVAYLKKGKGWEAYAHILDFLYRSHIRYALTHRLRIVFDSLVKQLWATTTVHNHEAGPSQIIANIDGIQTTDPSPRPTFDFTAKLFSNMKLNWDGPHMSLLAYMLVVPAGEDGVDAVAAGVAAAHDGAVTSEGPTPVREPTPCPMREPTPVSSRPPSPPPRSEEVGPTTSTRPPSPTRQSSFHEDITKGGGDFVSSPTSNEAPPTPAATAAGGAEDSAALTALSIKLHRCINRVTSLENKLGITKKVLGGAVLKLVTRVKQLEGPLQQRKRRLVLSDSEGEDDTPTEQDIDLEALHTLASTSLGDDSTEKAAGAGIPAAATTIPAGSSMDAAVHAAATPSSPILAVDKGKAPMVDDTFPGDLLSKQERILKNLHDYQLGKDLAKKLHAEQEAEFARQQEELAQKAQAERVASPTKHGLGLPDQRRRELDAALLIYTEADWVKLLAKIATNSTLSKQLLGDDITEDNMNERLGILLRIIVLRFTIKVPAASSQVPAAPSFAADVSVSAATTLEVPADESRPADTPTASVHVFVEPSVAASTPLSSRKRRNDSGSDDDPLLYAPYAGWEMVPSPLVPVHAYYDMAGHTKHFTSLHELLHMGDLHVLFQSLDDEDAHDFWRNQDSWRFRSWHLYPRAQVYILETMDGQVIYMFVDVSYTLSAATLECMLKHGLDVPKLLVRGDLTMAEQLSWLVQEQTTLGKDNSNPLTVGSLLKTIWSSLHHLLTNEVLTSPEQTALSKDVSNPFMAVMVCQKPLGYFSSLMIHVLRAELMLLFHDLAVFGVPAGLSCWSPYSCWFLVAAFCLVATGFVLFMLLE
nr:hypothetical protein [Tanacetum cinerariifolium]